MEYYNFLKVREEWAQKPCDHPKLEKLYYAGAFLVSYACTQCGEEFTIYRKMEMDEIRKENNFNKP